MILYLFISCRRLGKLLNCRFFPLIFSFFFLDLNDSFVSFLLYYFHPSKSWLRIDSGYGNWQVNNFFYDNFFESCWMVSLGLWILTNWRFFFVPYLLIFFFFFEKWPIFHFFVCSNFFWITFQRYLLLNEASINNTSF